MESVTAHADKQISIHALREEGDRARSEAGFRTWHFYPRPPRGGRHGISLLGHHSGQFLSTPSARRATSAYGRVNSVADISIHALREEGDMPCLRWKNGLIISIHALREEGDASALRMSFLTSNFYPRPPRGGRPEIFPHSLGIHIFLSTPSARRATYWPKNQR